MSYLDPKLDPNLKPHWHAVVKSADGTHFLTNQLYADPIQAKSDIGPGFVGLAQHLPPLHLPAAPARESRPAAPPPASAPQARSWPNTHNRRPR